MKSTNNTKDLILDVSLMLFAENSYHGASVRDIAKAIGKRESSIYNHFTSKEEILNQIITNFSSRNFGPLIITDKLISYLSKPEKFFFMLSENLLKFWSSKNEQMFIKVLLSSNNADLTFKKYTIENYLQNFRNLCEFIFSEMIKHNFITKINVKTLSLEFVSPLFLVEIEKILGMRKDKEIKSFLKSHVDFFWKAIKK